MAKKKYKVSNKPKVAQMNEYIYTDLKKDLAKKYMVNRPRMFKKDYAKKGVEVKFDKNIKRGKPMTAAQRRAAEAGIPTNTTFVPKTRQKGLSKNPVGLGEISNKKRMAQLKSQKAAGIGIGQPEPSQYKTNPSESQLPVEKQKIKSHSKPKGEIGGYKYGANSPVNLAKASKRLSPAAKRAVMLGAKVATKGATRLVPVVGQVLIAKDIYDVNKYASSLPKKKKSKMKLYGTSINKSYKYNR
jgi:hypothetical protein